MGDVQVVVKGCVYLSLLSAGHVHGAFEDDCLQIRSVLIESLKITHLYPLSSGLLLFRLP